LPRGIPGTQHKRETVAFAYCCRLKLSCLCPLPSCSNRTLKHGLFVAFRLLMQAGLCPNFRSLVSADICRFDNATKNTQFPLRRRNLRYGPAALLYRGSSQNFPPSRTKQLPKLPNSSSQQGLWPVSASQRRGVVMRERRHQKNRACCGGGAICTNTQLPLSLLQSKPLITARIRQQSEWPN
jgi:predicted outer membrane repeat protein